MEISIVIPTYNAGKFLQECIDSILNQTFTYWELIIVDDGSTDNTKEILKEYKDKRIKYIYKEHSGVGNSINIGIKNATGKYIARMDADDVMYPNRLLYQYNLMESHPEWDILAGGMEWGNGKRIKEYYKPETFDVSFHRLIQSCCISHPTVIMRKASIDKLPFLYESYYSCEDYKLWVTASSYGLKIHVDSAPVIWYRQHSEQVTNSNCYNIATDAKKVIKAYTSISGGPLTCIIAFREEKDEVEKTVTSIRATANQVNIILVDDCSNDAFNYKAVADRFGCKYYRNNEVLGSAGSKQKGIELCTTPYFCLFDAHTRLYDNDWDVKLIELLDKNPNYIFTSASIPFTKDHNGEYSRTEYSPSPDDYYKNGAFVNMEEKGWKFTAKWSSNLNTECNLAEIPCVLGSVYASSKEHWIKIGGLSGLLIYGLEEPFMSIKTWMSGGKCIIIRDWGVGHLYRTSMPCPIPKVYAVYNQLVLSYFFLADDKYKDCLDEIKDRVGDGEFNKAMELFNKNKENINNLKNNFYKNSTHSFDYFLDINNTIIGNQ